MDRTFLFYDLETTGKDPAVDRILQFAAQRTDQQLQPVEEPVNILVRLDDDILPGAGAAVVTGLTPQKTQSGMSELELVAKVQHELFRPNTIVVGYNNISFDDNFMRYAFWRNFYDPYEWAWKDGRSRWDLCNVTRMVRAIRPEGITWPFDENGKACNKLEKLTEANGLNHHQAHDGLSDVIALIELAQLIKRHQPRMFDYLLSMRDKNKVLELVNLAQPQQFVFTTTRYGHIHNYTSVACPIAEGTTTNAILTYNLRYDPTPWLRFSSAELAELRFTSYEDLEARGLTAFPVHSLVANQCPAVAPVGVLNEQEGWKRLELNPDTVTHHQQILRRNPEFIEAIKEAYQAEPYPDHNRDAEQRLYDGFLNDADRQTVASIRQADAARLATWSPYFHDERLPELFLHYKARNYRDTLSQSELELWKEYRQQKLKAAEPKFNAEMEIYRPIVDAKQKVLLEQLQQWHDEVVNR